MDGGIFWCNQYYQLRKQILEISHVLLLCVMFHLDVDYSLIILYLSISKAEYL